MKTFYLLFALLLTSVSIGQTQSFKHLPKTNQWKLKKAKGTAAEHLLFDEVGDFHGGVAIVRIGDDYGCVSGAGRVVVPIQFEEIVQPTISYFVVRNGDKYGAYSNFGEPLVPVEMAQIDHCEGLECVVLSNGDWRLYSDGKLQEEEDLVLHHPEIPAQLEKCASAEDADECTMKEVLMPTLRAVRYPPSARENGVQGRVVVGIAISEMGEVQGMQVLAGVDPACDQAALEAARIGFADTKWVPARLNGEAVASVYQLPLSFRLE